MVDPQDERLQRLESRLDRIERLLERLVAQGPAAAAPWVAMATDTLDEVAAELGPERVDARLQAGARAAWALSEPQLLDGLTRLAALAPRLEPLARLGAGFEDHLAIATDAADEWARQQGEAEVDQRLVQGARSLEVLSRPPVQAALVDLASLAPRLQSLAQLAAQLEPYLAMAVDAGDEIFREWSAEGVDADQRLRESLLLLRALTEPEHLAALRRALTHLPELANAAEKLPGWLAMAWDTFDELQREGVAEGYDLHEVVVGALRVIQQLAALTATPAVVSLLDSPLLEPTTVARTARLGDALARTLEDEGVQGVGPFGLLQGLRDPDVQRATGFLLAVARRMGEALATYPPVPHR